MFTLPPLFSPRPRAGDDEQPDSPHTGRHGFKLLVSSLAVGFGGLLASSVRDELAEQAQQARNELTALDGARAATVRELGILADQVARQRTALDAGAPAGAGDVAADIAAGRYDVAVIERTRALGLYAEPQPAPAADAE